MAVIAADPAGRACTLCGGPVVNRYRSAIFCSLGCKWRAASRRRTAQADRPVHQPSPAVPPHPETDPAPAPPPPASAQVAPGPSAGPAETGDRTSGQISGPSAEIVRPAVPGRRKFAAVLADLLAVERRIVELATAPRTRLSGDAWLNEAMTKAGVDSQRIAELDSLARTSESVNRYIQNLAAAFVRGEYRGVADVPWASVLPRVGRWPAQDLRGIGMKRAGLLAIASLRAITAHPEAFSGAPAAFLDSKAEAELAAARVRLRRELQAAPDLRLYVAIELAGVSIDERDRGLHRLRFRRPLPPVLLTEDWPANLVGRLLEAEAEEAAPSEARPAAPRRYEPAAQATL